MTVDKHLQEKIIEIKELLQLLQKAKSYESKLVILDSLTIVQDYLKQAHPVQNLLKNLTSEAQYAIKAIIAIGQGPIVFKIKGSLKDSFNLFVQLLEQLLEIEVFYKHMGGIIGYHLAVIELIYNQNTYSKVADHVHYIHPEGLHLSKDYPEVRKAVRWGIKNIKKIAAIYPLGGAGDRLNLSDDTTGTPLPAAKLPFLGRTLLENLIRDLQAIENLYFKLYKKQLLTPIAIMTSVEKNNHLHVLKICKACNWFGRPQESFYFFIQPVVPVITIEGNWSLTAPLTLTLKPCGHGVIWKLAEEQGVFKWLESFKRRQCFIRQINNPIAGTDQSILALIGVGCHQKKTFGFVSCDRLLNSDEGTNVLIETKREDGFDYCLTNIEYTDFQRRGIDETPAKLGSPYSIYPSNTNILFADIPSIRKILKICPIPGQLINMKSKVTTFDDKGNVKSTLGGRLESTMQNIADHIINHFSHSLNKEQRMNDLSSFIIYNDRVKTISTTKKSFKKGESLVSTPEQAYYDLLLNHYDLLKQCHFELPARQNIEDYLHKGPSCIFLFHPSLGPLFSVITQKIRKGVLKGGSELQIEIAEVDIENLSLEGSLLIESDPPLGSYNISGYLDYSKGTRCTLKNVKIKNKGIDRELSQHYWKNEMTRHEAVKVVLYDGAEFYAEGISLEGPHLFEVPSHHQLILKPSKLTKTGWEKELIPISQPSWYWRYSFDNQNAIKLKKVKTKKRTNRSTHPLISD